MNNKIVRTIKLTGALGGLFGMSQALAAPILVDFTDSMWSGADGQTSYSQSYGSLDVTLTSTGGAMTFNAGGPASGGSLALDGDGIGIGDDEVGGAGGETLGVSFSSDVTVLGFYFLDMFVGEGPAGEAEMGYASFSTGDTLSGYGSASDGVGYYAYEGIALNGVSSVGFSAGSGGYSGWQAWFSDFAVAGILIDFASPLTAVLSDNGAAAVPEPATLGLLGLGLLGFGYARGRRA